MVIAWLPVGISGHVWQWVQQRLLLALGRDNRVASRESGTVHRFSPDASEPLRLHVKAGRVRSAILDADPNPVLIASITTTTISWDTEDGSIGEVWVSRDGGPESLLAHGASGRQAVPWIAEGSGYVFTLYVGAEFTVSVRTLAVLTLPSHLARGRHGSALQLRLTARLARRLMRQRFHLWFYFHFLSTVLNRCQDPVWHLPACVLATIRVGFDRDAQALSEGLTAALSLPTSRWARWRLRWSLSYFDEVRTLCILQMSRLTPEWAAAQVDVRGVLPPGGAVIIQFHQAMAHVTRLRFAHMGIPYGGIALRPTNLGDMAQLDPIIQHQLAAVGDHYERTPDYTRFQQRHAARHGLQFLREGGYLGVAITGFLSGWPDGVIFGRSVPLPDGPIWFAERSGRPIVPVMVTARGGRIALQIGEAVAPTQEAVREALEANIRRAPSMWERVSAMKWLRAPIWPIDKSEQF